MRRTIIISEGHGDVLFQHVCLSLGVKSCTAHTCVKPYWDGFKSWLLLLHKSFYLGEIKSLVGGIVTTCIVHFKIKQAIHPGVLRRLKVKVLMDEMFNNMKKSILKNLSLV